MKRLYDGMFDNSAKHGEITGYGVNFESAMRKFAKRQSIERQPGKWRRAPTKWKVNNGTRIDPDWFIVDYGQEP